MKEIGRPKKVIERDYPRVTPGAEFTIIELAKMWQECPDFLTHKDCNYSPELKQALGKISMFGLFVGGKSMLDKLEEAQAEAQASQQNFPQHLGAGESSNIALQDLDIAAESASLYQTLKTTLKSIDKMETNEKVQILRTATSLMEKLLTLQEKAVAVSQYAQFKNIVMNMMDRYLNPVQIAELVSELEEANSQT